MALKDFMKLEKVVVPDEWLEKNNIKSWFKSIDEFIKSKKKKGVIIIPIGSGNFYDLCIRMESSGYESFLIYPILDNRYWIIEIPSWRTKNG